MNRLNSRARLLTALLIMCLFPISYATNIDKIVAFGDSLSDNGNLFALTNRLHETLVEIPIIPKDPPYYRGRFTNGENWLDLLAKESGLMLVNHAYGGAWAEAVSESTQLIPFNINDQVGLYIVENVLDFNKSRHLFAIWVGANDYLQGRDDVDYATTNTINNIQKQIERLIYYGARQFLIMSLPDMTKAPYFVGKDPDRVAQVKKLGEEHNKKLSIMVKEEQQKNAAVKIILVDMKAAFDDLHNRPEVYQLTNTREACYDGSLYLERQYLGDKVLAAANQANLNIQNNITLRIAYTTSQLAEREGKICANPDEYLFWDLIHPTRIVHRIVASIAIAELQAHDIRWPVK